MKETPIFEEVFLRLFRQRGSVVKVLVGSLLSFIPVANFLAFGYLYRFSRETRRSGNSVSPNGRIGRGFSWTACVSRSSGWRIGSCRF